MNAQAIDREIEDLVRQVDACIAYGDPDDREISEPTAATWGGGGSSDDLPEEVPF